MLSSGENTLTISVSTTRYPPFYTGILTQNWPANGERAIREISAITRVKWQYTNHIKAHKHVVIVILISQHDP
jgi:hypothetical protein